MTIKIRNDAHAGHGSWRDAWETAASSHHLRTIALMVYSAIPTGRNCMLKKKICLLGAFAVGKTSLVERYVYSRFDDRYLTTIGVKVSEKRLPPVTPEAGGPAVQFTFLIWDIAGMEKFSPAVENYYRGASGALAVADLTRPETIARLDEVCAHFMTVNPHAKLHFAGNKQDLFDNDTTTLQQLNQMAAAFSSPMLLTSAKTDNNVEEAFLKLAAQLETDNARSA
jgi:small GTP-binding protein